MVSTLSPIYALKLKLKYCHFDAIFFNGCAESRYNVWGSQWPNVINITFPFHCVSTWRPFHFRIHTTMITLNWRSFFEIECLVRQTRPQLFPAHKCCCLAFINAYCTIDVVVIYALDSNKEMIRTWKLVIISSIKQNNAFCLCPVIIICILNWYRRVMAIICLAITPHKAISIVLININIPTRFSSERCAMYDDWKYQ